MVCSLCSVLFLRQVTPLNRMSQMGLLCLTAIQQHPLQRMQLHLSPRRHLVLYSPPSNSQHSHPHQP
ncbi:hypothetical protein U0070_000319 [Myodes glareolus]|uniref:Uncharacterized protein n=1 Tax=Myodes glareolus TaxID=447135 RepID=A0AAW0HBM6_MYOGA